MSSVATIVETSAFAFGPRRIEEIEGN